MYGEKLTNFVFVMCCQNVFKDDLTIIQMAFWRVYIV